MTGSDSVLDAYLELSAHAAGRGSRNADPTAASHICGRSVTCPADANMYAVIIMQRAPHGETTAACTYGKDQARTARALCRPRVRSALTRTRSASNFEEPVGQPGGLQAPRLSVTL